MFNPIVTFFFFFGLAITVIFSSSLIKISILAFLAILLLIFNHKNLKSIFKQIRPFLFFMPIFIILYILFSWLFTDSNFSQILIEALTAIIKLLLLISIMSIYFELSKKHNLIMSVRTIWSKLNIRWRWVDDVFIFLELTLRFYPSFKNDWNNINRSKKALGLKQNQNRWDKVKSVANDLPGIILYNYKRAENTALIMVQRGYGKTVPRGVAQPVNFRLIDGISLVVIIISIFIINKYVTL